MVEVGIRARRPRTQEVESGARTVAVAASGSQVVESVTLTVNRTYYRLQPRGDLFLGGIP